MHRLRIEKCCKCNSKEAFSLETNTCCESCMNCCMRFEKDSFGRVGHCNTLKPPIVRLENGQEKTYCIGHWKARTQRCRFCECNDVETFHDSWAYCSAHRPSETSYKCNLISCLRQMNSLPDDLSLLIIKQTSAL